MRINIAETRRKFERLGVDFSGFESKSEERKLAFIEMILQERRLAPVYVYDSFEAPNSATPSTRGKGSGSRSEDSIAAKIEREMPVSELRSRFKFDFNKGEIYDYSTGRRVDQLHFFRQRTKHNVRYLQVHVSLRGLTGKLSAHRMIWAAYHNRWPQPGMVIDHINRNTMDNSIANLRECTSYENNTNKGEPLLATDYNQLGREKAQRRKRLRHIPAIRK